MDELKTADSRIAELEQIDINQWVRFGEGSESAGYYHVTNEDLMLKLFLVDISYEDVESEYNTGYIANSLNIPAPATYKMVAYDGKPGIIFQRLHDKVSVSRAIGQDPDRMEEYVQQFVELMHHIHATQADTEVMVPAIERYRKAIDDSYYLSDSVRKYFYDFLDDVPCPTTCIHGDFHVGNVVIAQGKTYAIDLTLFSYGCPHFDEASFSNICNITAKYKPEFFRKTYHMSSETMGEVWRVFCRLHAGAETPSQREEYEHMLWPYMIVDNLRKTNTLGAPQKQISLLTKLIQEKLG